MTFDSLPYCFTSAYLQKTTWNYNLFFNKQPILPTRSISLPAHSIFKPQLLLDYTQTNTVKRKQLKSKAV